MGRRNRQKGAEWDREVRDLFRPWFPDAKRGLQARGAAADNVADVINTPYWIECKSGKNIPWKDAVVQASSETDGRPWLVFVRCERLDGRSPGQLVMMDVSLFREFMEWKHGKAETEEDQQQATDAQRAEGPRPPPAG